MKKQLPKKACLYCRKKYRPRVSYQKYCCASHAQMMWWRKKLDQVKQAQKIILEKGTGL